MVGDILRASRGRLALKTKQVFVTSDGSTFEQEEDGLYYEFAKSWADQLKKNFPRLSEETIADLVNNLELALPESVLVASGELANKKPA